MSHDIDFKLTVHGGCKPTAGAGQVRDVLSFARMHAANGGMGAKPTGAAGVPMDKIQQNQTHMGNQIKSRQGPSEIV